MLEDRLEVVASSFFSCAESSTGLYNNQFLYQVLRFFAEVVWELVLQAENLLEDLVGLNALERDSSGKHLENDTAESPEVSSKIGLVVLDHLRSHVVHSSNLSAFASGVVKGVESVFMVVRFFL